MSGRSCVIFGGAGFIGAYLARHLLSVRGFSHVHIADINRSELSGLDGISTSLTDVREPISPGLSAFQPRWIFNLAAIHREPGHIAQEYFDTNLQGATNVCEYAEACGCPNVYFASSISVYGPTLGPTDEDAPICPITPYGGSKYPAELIHRTWQSRGSDRRLVICRPAVVYGPGDPGNIMRMMRAVRRGYFAFPGSSSIHKSYAYIFGLLDSIDFVMERGEPVICYNYAEYPTEPLASVIIHTKKFVNSSAPVLSIPIGMLMPAAHIAQMVLGRHNPIHPIRVRKAAMPTHIIPAWLRDNGFRFRFTYETSLGHWRSVAPQDFA